MKSLHNSSEMKTKSEKSLVGEKTACFTFSIFFTGEKVGKRVPGRAVAAAFSTTEDCWLVRFSTDVRRRVGTFFHLWGEG